MKIKLLTRLAGPDWSAAPGEVIEVPEGIGKVLVERGFAESLTPDPSPEGRGEEIETTMMPPEEVALSKAGKKGRKR